MMRDITINIDGYTTLAGADLLRDNTETEHVFFLLRDGGGALHLLELNGYYEFGDAWDDLSDITPVTSVTELGAYLHDALALGTPEDEDAPADIAHMINLAANLL